MSDDKPRAKQVWFLPWADLKEPLNLGKCSIWPVNSDSLAEHFEPDVSTHLANYFRSYVDHGGNPVNTIAVCSYSNRGVSRMREDEIADLKLVVDILSFCVISKGYRVFLRNKQNQHASADRFKLICQSFIPGNNWLAVSSGRTLSGGWTIGQITFSRPWCVGGPFQKVDQRLFDAFEPLFAKGFDKDSKARFAKSLEWFRLAQTDSEDVSPENKIVMLATAIESLLAVPKDFPNKQLWIARWLDENCTYSASIKKTWRGADPGEHSAIGYWARSFYDLRNSIVHGDTARTLWYASDAGTRLGHLHVATLVYWECLTRKLFQAGSFADVRKIADGISLEDNDDRRHILMTLLDASDIHRALGWLPTLNQEIAANSATKQASS